MSESSTVTTTEPATSATTVEATAAATTTPGQTAAEATGDQVQTTATGTQPTAVATPPGPPERYEWTAPDGRTYDQEVLTAFEGVARDLGLPQDRAQSVLDRMAPVLEQRAVALQQAQRAHWETQARADKDIGGDKLEASLAGAKRAMVQFAAPEFSAFLESSGLGSHPEMIRMLSRVSAALGEDRMVSGGGQVQTTRPDLAKSLYPSMMGGNT